MMSLIHCRSLRSGSRNGWESRSQSVRLCLGSLAASGPAKVVGLETLIKWNTDWPSDFGGPAAIGEATEATATGMAPEIHMAIDFKTGQTRSPAPKQYKPLKTETNIAINGYHIHKTWPA